MIPGRVYYPLRATRGRYVQPSTIYLSVDSYQGNFERAEILDGGVVHLWNTAQGLTEYLQSVNNKTWVITYGLEWLSAAVGPLLDCFIISGYGQETHLITLSNDDKEIYIIDLFAFFGRGLIKSTMRKAGLNTAGLDHSPGRVVGIAALWELYRDTLRRVYGVHPSKTPGATALKCYRPTMNNYIPIKPRGRPVSKLSIQGQTGGALHWIPGIYSAAFAYDVNASYPFVMTQARFPLRMYAFSDNPPPSNRWIATIRLDYRSNYRFSPLAVRLADNSITHPTAASGLVITLNYIDYLTLAACGEVKILEWIEGVMWYPKDEYPLFAKWGAITEQALKADPSIKGLMKITSRALHSKFSQTGEVKLIEIRQVTPRFVTEHRESIADLYILPGGKLAAKILTPKPSAFQCYYRPDLEQLVLSLARLKLYSAIDKDTIYCDTDCIISTTQRHDLDIGPGWGEWKSAGYGLCVIAGPRMYAIGQSVKMSGINPQDRQELIVALKAAATGHPSNVQAVESPGLGNLFIKESTREHTVKMIPYPKVIVRGGLAYITASPTTIERIKPVKRVIT